MTRGEVKIPACHVAELTDFFAAHDRWLFGHACARTRGDRELAADLVQDTVRGGGAGLGHAARAARPPAARPGCSARWPTRTSAASGARRRSAAGSPRFTRRYQPAAADTEAEALNAIALAAARKIIDGHAAAPAARSRCCAGRTTCGSPRSRPRLGIAEGTVHSALHTARGKLSAGLERYDPSGEGDES